MRFNANFIALPSTQLKVMSLQKPIQKMSKSDTSELSTLNILDTSILLN